MWFNSHRSIEAVGPLRCPPDTGSELVHLFSAVPDSNVKEFCNHFSFGPVIRFRAFIVMAISNRLKSVKAWLGLLCLGSALFTSACANDEGSSDTSSQHHRHHGGGGGGGRSGHGEGAMFDQSNPSGSQSPVPGQ